MSSTPIETQTGCVPGTARSFTSWFVDRWTAGSFLAIVACALAIRLAGITQPFVDSFGWRQSDVAMIARNFLLGGFDILHPQVDWSAHTSGVVGTEFPLVPLLAALLYSVFGVQDWIGRGIPIVFFLLSMPFFYLLVARLSNRGTGLLALALYSFTPLSIYTSRSFMPDAVALSLSVAGLYYLLVWVDSLRFGHLAAAALLVCLALLVKISYGMILLSIAYLSFARFGWDALRKKSAWFFVLVAVLPAIGWYLNAQYVPTAELVMGSEKRHIFGGEGFGIASAQAYLTILHVNFWPYLTPVPVLLAAAGIFSFGKKHRNGKLFHYWLLAMIAFVFLVGYGNRHPWYQLPLVPIISAFAAGACDRGLRRLTRDAVPSRAYCAAAVGLMAVLAGLYYVGLGYNYTSSDISCVQAAETVDRMAPAEGRVLIADDGNPSCMYYSRRTGWHFWTPRDDRDAIDAFERYRAAGAGYLILDANHLWWLQYYKTFAAYLDARFEKLSVTDHYVIFSLVSDRRR